MTIKRLNRASERESAPYARLTRVGQSVLTLGDALDSYESWLAPTCIISDGPYGLGKYPGEPNDPKELAAWYAPHIAAWAKYSKANTTLWFWNSEVGWANVHSTLELHGWQYEECCVWDKGVAHVAGNCNSKTIRGAPVVTEVAVRYTRKVQLPNEDGLPIELKEWIRSEWLRSGLPMNQANKACGVANAATRKYLTQCHLWYFPPADAMMRMMEYCSRHGKRSTRPYFSIDGKTPLSERQWTTMRAKWNHVHGTTNVWRANAVHGNERIKHAKGYLHANQKPLALMDYQICASTDEGDVVWEPFAGLASGSLAAMHASRRSFAAEIRKEYFDAATERLLGQRSLLTEHRNAA